jgi:hypothetical protein
MQSWGLTPTTAFDCRHFLRLLTVID